MEANRIALFSFASFKALHEITLHLPMQIDLMGECLTLLPERALLWEKEKTLIVADLHWGKSAHFRKHGIAVPASTQTGDELRLASLLREHNIQRLVIAGDLFHSTANKQVDIFSHFRQGHASLHIDLVIGNHDILPADQYTLFNLQRHDRCLEIGPFCIAHDAIPSQHFVIHGHVHPSVRIHGRGSQTLKLCCFAQSETRMILPAFGAFTGTHNLNIDHWSHIYLVGETEVIQWK